ncbi:glycosyltransferase family 4 protein [Colwellia echini]|nr:glycosyltransferase family 4 protein [Colwellia echini]
MQVKMVLNRYYPMIGGAERQARILSLELLKQGVTPSIITQKHDSKLLSTELIDGIKVTRYSSGVMFYCMLFIALIKDRNNVDVIHCHNISITSFVCSLASLFIRCPLVLKLTVAGELTELLEPTLKGLKPRLKSILIKYTVKRATIIALTQEGIKELEAHKISAYTHIPNGVSLELRDLVVQSNKLQKIKSYRTFGFLGRFSAQKGIEVLLKAFSQSITENKLILMGSSHLQESTVIDEEILKFKKLLGDRLVVLEPENPPLKFYNMIDCFVSTSKFEGMPNCVLEALSLNIPCVLSPIPPHKEISDSCNAPEIKIYKTNEELISIFEHSDLVLSENELLPEKYNIENVAYKYKFLYEQLIG